MDRLDRKHRGALPRRAHLKLEQLEPRELLDAASSANFVGMVYQDLLHRSADASGLAAFTTALEQGALTRLGVALAIEGSPEYHAGQVEALYGLLLHRPADPNGLSSFTAFLAAGGSPEQGGALLAGSPEYFQTRGGGTNDGFLTAIYSDLLHRSVDPGARTTLDQLLAMGM